MVMPQLDQGKMDYAGMVEPDRVRRELYTDEAIFQEEMARIHERVWIYVGHESQVPKAGDYCTAQVGRQPMIMVRGADGKVNVLYNRCPHRGNMICGDMKGNAGDQFRCSYHAWTLPSRRPAQEHSDDGVRLPRHSLHARQPGLQREARGARASRTAVSSLPASPRTGRR